MKKLMFLLAIVASVSCKKEVSFTRPPGLPPIEVKIEQRNAANWCMEDSLLCIGDSFLYDQPWYKGIPTRFAEATGRPLTKVFFGGVSGETSTQCADRREAMAMYVNCPMLIWTGHNNNYERAKIIADLHRIIGKNKKFLIFEVTSGNLPDRWPGGPYSYYESNQQLNKGIIAEFGIEHFVPIVKPLQQFQNGSRQDSIDVSHDCIPGSLTADYLHLNADGMDRAVGEALKKLLTCKAN